MKKIKFLPLLAVGLLALVGCGSSGGQEISRKKALEKYDPAQTDRYTLSMYERENGIDTALREDKQSPYYPEAVNGKLKGGDAEIVAIAGQLATTEMYEKLFYFQENVGLDKSDVFFNNFDDYTLELAKIFQETPTYTVDGKKLEAHFTGSVEIKVAEKDYGLAMHYVANFNKVGLLTSTTFELIVATDLNAKNEVETLLRFKGYLNCEYFIS